MTWHSPKDRLEAARSQQTSPNDLSVLSRCEHSFVQTAVAGNPNTSDADLLEMVPDDPNTNALQELVAAIAKNTAASGRTLSRIADVLAGHLSNDRADRVAFSTGVTLCRNAATPISAIRQLLDPDQTSNEFRKVVARETDRRDVLDLLEDDRSEKVRRAVRGNVP